MNLNFNVRNVRQKEMRKLTNSIKSVVDMSKTSSDVRDISNGIMTSAGQQLNRITMVDGQAAMGIGGTVVS